MKHKKTHKNLLYTLGAITVLSFGVAACDSSEETTTTTAPVETSGVAADGIDYSTVITAGEVRDGVAFGDLVMGDPDAPVTIVEYASLTCSHCAAFHTDVFPAIKEQYIATGKVRFVYRNFTRDPADLAVGMLTRCVGPENAFELMAIFFDRQRQWAFGADPKTEIAAIARQQAGIGRTDFDACLANTDLQNSLVSMVQQGQSEGVRGTPTFFIEGEVFVGEQPFEVFVEIIEDNM